MALLLCHLDGPLPDLGSQLGDHLGVLEQLILLQSPLRNILELVLLGKFPWMEQHLPILISLILLLHDQVLLDQDV